MKCLTLAATVLAFACVHANAADDAKPKTAQQSLMATCNKDATGKKGDERKAFMSSCLSDGKKRQQEKMKMCAAENKGKKGDEYKTAQSECLKK